MGWLARLREPSEALTSRHVVDGIDPDPLGQVCRSITDLAALSCITALLLLWNDRKAIGWFGKWRQVKCEHENVAHA